MTQSTVFFTNRTQAVRLPKSAAFPDSVKHVDVLTIGKSRVIVPSGTRWDDLFDRGPDVSEDFLDTRESLPAEPREPF